MLKNSLNFLSGHTPHSRIEMSHSNFEGTLDLTKKTFNIEIPISTHHENLIILHFTTVDFVFNKRISLMSLNGFPSHLS